jgi:hypothetical protein
LYPKAFPLFQAMYGKNSCRWHKYGEDHLDYILSCEGNDQGDNLGSFFFCNALHGLLEGLQNMLNGLELSDGQVLFYIDNGYVICKRGCLKSVLDYFKTEGAAYGFYLNLDKTEILLSHRLDDELYLSDVKLLTEQYGFKLDINLHCHPLNRGDNVVSYDSTTFRPDNHIWKTSFVPSYGLQILGVPIGTNAYVDQQLAKQIQNWQTEVTNLINQCQNKQILMHLIHTCFQHKCNYILSLLPPDFN